MPFVILDHERFALPIGETVLGGPGDDAVPIPELAALPPVAIVAVGPDGGATIRRYADRPVVVNGQPLGEEPVTLAHGAHIIVAHVRLTFGDLHEIGTTEHVTAVTDDEIALLGALPPVPTADSGGRLVRRDGTVVAIHPHGLVIGRDPGVDVVLTGKAASRRHATIRPTLQGYLVVNESPNGTLVNRHRVDESQLLGMGDVIRAGEEDLRFEADPAPAEPMIPPRASQPRPAAPPEPAAPSPSRGGTLLATLEIVNEGVMKGTRFRIERPAVHIGRGEHNEVRLSDKSVSGAHATLTRRGKGWFVLDLGSTNGTYVDGERITGERRLPGVSELRFGDIKMVFRPIAGVADDDGSTRAVVAVPD